MSIHLHIVHTGLPNNNRDGLWRRLCAAWAGKDCQLLVYLRCLWLSGLISGHRSQPHYFSLRESLTLGTESLSTGCSNRKWPRHQIQLPEHTALAPTSPSSEKQGQAPLSPGSEATRVPTLPLDIHKFGNWVLASNAKQKTKRKTRPLPTALQWEHQSLGSMGLPLSAESTAQRGS